MGILINTFDPEESRVVEYGFIDTPFGKAMIAFNSQGVCGFEFADDDNNQIWEDKMRAEWSDLWAHRNKFLDKLLFGIFFQKNNELTFPLYLCVKGTPFQVEVWKALTSIPEGTTVTYTDVANMIGRPESVRAVASAIAENKIGMFIPCHRVVPMQGGVGEYRWGTDRKERILEWEKESAGK